MSSDNTAGVEQSALKHDNARKITWTVIVITAPDRESAYAFDFSLYFSKIIHRCLYDQNVLIVVLRQRQHYGLIDKSTILLTVNDPQDKLGSGGATLNALLVATEHLSARAGYSVSKQCRFFIQFG